MLAFVIGYLLFVKYGMLYMKNKKALDLKFFMMIYNFGLILLSFYIAYEVSLVMYVHVIFINE